MWWTLKQIWKGYSLSMICDMPFFSWNEINEPNVQACFLGCNQAQESPRLELNALAKLPEGLLQKSVFSVTGKIFHAISHCNTIFLRMVSIIYSESGLAYGENEAGFRLLNFTRTRGWASVIPAGGARVFNNCCCSCCYWVDDRNDGSASGVPPASACKTSHHPIQPTSHGVVVAQLP